MNPISMSCIVGQDIYKNLKYIYYGFLKRTFVVRQSSMLHCEDVTMQEVVLWKSYWSSLHDLEELFPFAWL